MDARARRSSRSRPCMDACTHARSSRPCMDACTHARAAAGRAWTRARTRGRNASADASAHEARGAVARACPPPCELVRLRARLSGCPSLAPQRCVVLANLRYHALPPPATAPGRPALLARVCNLNHTTRQPAWPAWPMPKGETCITALDALRRPRRGAADAEGSGGAQAPNADGGNGLWHLTVLVAVGGVAFAMYSNRERLMEVRARPRANRVWAVRARVRVCGMCARAGCARVRWAGCGCGLWLRAVRACGLCVCVQSGAAPRPARQLAAPCARSLRVLARCAALSQDGQALMELASVALGPTLEEYKEKIQALGFAR